MTIGKSLLYNIPELLNFSTAYFTLKAGRCALLSLFLLLVIMLLRYTAFRRKILLKGALWSIMPLTLFGGTLKVFDENPFALKWFGWWKDVCASRLFIGYIYLIGVIIVAIYIVRQRKEFRKAIRSMKRVSLMGKSIYICESNITPFSSGLLKPGIILPDLLYKNYSSKELEIILQHEETHIKLGHLWFYAFWDVLKIVFWFNPLIYVCLPYFKQDMEDICDRVAIQRSGCKPYAYGQLLLKSMQLLAGKEINLFPALIEKRDYGFFKERIIRIIQYKPYKKEVGMILIGCCLLTVISGIYLLKSISYPSYTMHEKITVFQVYEPKILIDDVSELNNAIYYDEENLYINNEQFMSLLNLKGVYGNEFYIGINGYEKIPHWGSGMDSIYVDCSKLSGGTSQIAYGNQYDAVTKIVQWIIKEVL
ncbi:hypothetical protein JCM11672_26320 [Alkaliphilus crotonatoxidans]